MLLSQIDLFAFQGELDLDLELIEGDLIDDLDLVGLLDLPELDLDLLGLLVLVGLLDFVGLLDLVGLLDIVGLFDLAELDRDLVGLFDAQNEHLRESLVLELARQLVDGGNPDVVEPSHLWGGPGTGLSPIIGS